MDVLEVFFGDRQHLSKTRKNGYRQAFAALARYSDHPFEVESREEMLRCLAKMEKDYAAQTYNLYVAGIRAWYKWRYGNDEEYPDAVKKIKLKKIRREDYIKTKILSEAEIQAMLRVADHPRDRALVAFYAATGCRLSEALSIHMRDVHELGNVGFEFVVTGKTGTYVTPPVVGGYAACIRAWLDHHPYRDNPDAPLWIRIVGTRRYESIGDERVYALVKQLAQRAGLKRNVHPHMFRHTQSREDAKNKIPMSTRKKRHGWTANSTMPALYEHLTDEDGTEIYLKTYGLSKQEPEEKSLFGVVECVFCHEQNSSAAKYCSRCGTVLNREEAEEIIRKQRFLDVLERELSDPKKHKRFKEWLETL